MTNVTLATIILHYTHISLRDHDKPGNTLYWQIQRRPAVFPGNTSTVNQRGSY